MTDPHSTLRPGVLTYRDFLLVAAQEYGFDFLVAGVPSLDALSEAERFRCEQAVTRGISMWVGSNRAGWEVLNQRYSIDLKPDGDGPYNLDGDAQRYRMPWSFAGETQGAWTCNDPLGAIPIIREDQARAIDSEWSASFPYGCAFRRVTQTKPTSEQIPAWEAVFAPKPSQEMTVTIAYRASIVGMQQESDVFIAGDPYDRSVERAIAYMVMVLGKFPDAEKASRKADFDEAIAEALAIDERARPAGLGVASNQLGSPYFCIENENDRGPVTPGDLIVNGVNLGS